MFIYKSSAKCQTIAYHVNTLTLFFFSPLSTAAIKSASIQKKISFSLSLTWRSRETGWGPGMRVVLAGGGSAGPMLAAHPTSGHRSPLSLYCICRSHSLPRVTSRHTDIEFSLLRGMDRKMNGWIHDVKEGQVHEDERCMKWWTNESNLVYSGPKGLCGENVWGQQYTFKL